MTKADSQVETCGYRLPSLHDSIRAVGHLLNDQNLADAVLVQRQLSFDHLATEWRQQVDQPFKAGI